MGKGNDAPPSPDPRQTAQAESQFNRLDTYSPAGGGVRYGYTDPATGGFVAGLAPDGVNAQAAVRSIETPTEARLRSMLEPASEALTGRIIADNVTGMPAAPRVQDRGTVAQDIFDRNFSMMMPGIDRANSRLIQNLQARGIPVGAAAFNDAYGEQQRQTQDTISRLAQDANVAAGAEQQRLLGMDQSVRQGAIAEIVAAMGGGYNPPNAAPGGNAAQVNYSGLVGDAYRANLAQHQQNQQARMGTASALGGLGAALIKSSRTVKSIEGIACDAQSARLVSALPIYGWRYNTPPYDVDPDMHCGPMAEDFHELTGLGRPDAISAVDMMGLLASALRHTLARLSILEAHVLKGTAAGALDDEETDRRRPN